MKPRRDRASVEDVGFPRTHEELPLHDLPRTRDARRLRTAGSIVMCGAIVAACSSGGPSVRAPRTLRPADIAAVTAPAPPTAATTATLATTATPDATPATTPTTPAAPTKPKPKPPLAGKVVGIDPGHNGANYTNPTFLNHLIWNGRNQETCDTTGTATNGGYSEARFNFNVATYLAGDLRAAGAKTVLTRRSNSGVGPCVTTRAQIIDRAHANVAIDIHADGGPPGGRGFAILEPIADGPNHHVIGSSISFGRYLRQSYRAVTGMPESTYDGSNGIAFRSDLAGLNLTTVPKVLIECGNMRNATDAALLVSPAFQRQIAKAMAQAITRYLT